LIGAGGAARAISFFLAKEIKTLTIIDTVEASMALLSKLLSESYPIPISYSSWDSPKIKKIFENAEILINSTPVGMYPKVDESPVKPELLHSDMFVFDVVYNPLETKLIQQAKKIGLKTLNGIEMFVNQGALAFEWWTGKKPDKKLMKQVIIEQLKAKK
jgi:shikimate dehydrogenase